MSVLVGPHAVIRPTLAHDEWISGALDRLNGMARERGGVLLGVEVEAEVPVEARCLECQRVENVRAIAPGELVEDYTAYLKGEGAAIGPVTLMAAQRWVAGHLLWRHKIDGIGASYTVESGTERWLA